jgi:5-methylcytosine-specific restriction endonuclease McrA
MRKKPIRMSQMCKYTAQKIGIGAQHKTSIHELVCKALDKDGKPKPPGMSAKSWTYLNADYIKNENMQNAVKRESWNTKRPVASSVVGDAFLASYEWRRLRMVALTKYGARCQCCGATPSTGAVMNVDHIKPRRLFPDLALTLDNLQILCHECNHGKGNWDRTDWRPVEEHVDYEVVAMLREIANG